MKYLVVVRRLMKAANGARRMYWRWRGQRIYGATALAFTPGGHLILIRQTYSNGWVLPGGGRKPSETPVEAALRELREEIGLFRWTGARSLGCFDRMIAGVPASVDLVQIDGAEFAFRQNLEVEAVSTFALNTLPADIAPWSVGFIREAGHR